DEAGPTNHRGLHHVVDVEGRRIRQGDGGCVVVKPGGQGLVAVEGVFLEPAELDIGDRNLSQPPQEDRDGGCVGLQVQDSVPEVNLSAVINERIQVRAVVNVKDSGMNRHCYFLRTSWRSGYMEALLIISTNACSGVLACPPP